ncbi:hypothetical protein HMI54_003028 [Coelomomyces lativittatus]|nr:hypothetical protein HMI55_002266 [Coelomomyces lativittatus]KAJ1508650.1 hypothetical protein HMI54_003028 [Coelomomyces lativittatus]KAJ1515323.1 hypothetical protein HMI56_005753 [Coelomomyces lativittatus]
MYYAGAFLFFFLGSSYAAVPLYRMFCSAIGVGGTTLSPNLSKSHDLTTLGSFPIKVNFLSNTSLTLPWSFIPSQPSLEVRPGETALAFYTAHNKTNQPIIGIATYNVVPAAVAPYFNKIQCFCFEEQPLGPNETVDMPVFFFIDPAIEDDPVAAQYKDVTLSYTFFKAKEPL